MSLPGCAAIPAPYRERGADRLRDRPAHGRDGARGSEAIRHSDPRRVRERHRRCSAIGGSTNAPIHIIAIARHVGVALSIGRLGDHRLRRPAPGEHAAGRRISRRGVLSRRRIAGGDERTPRRRRVHGDARTINGQTIAENLGSAKATNPRVIRPYDQPLKAARGLQGAARQPVRFRDHEDQRDLRRIPPALSRRPERSECVRGPRRRVRWAGGLSPAHRRSGARHRRTYHLVHARRRARSAIRAPPRWSTCSRPRR